MGYGKVGAGGHFSVPGRGELAWREMQDVSHVHRELSWWRGRGCRDAGKMSKTRLPRSANGGRVATACSSSLRNASSELIGQPGARADADSAAIKPTSFGKRLLRITYRLAESCVEQPGARRYPHGSALDCSPVAPASRECIFWSHVLSHQNTLQANCYEGLIAQLAASPIVRTGKNRDVCTVIGDCRRKL